MSNVMNNSTSRVRSSLKKVLPMIITIAITGAMLLSAMGSDSGLQAAAFAQSPVTSVVKPKVLPQVPPPSLGLPPEPSITDWQPRGRAAAGGIIIITGQGLRPAEFEAVVGSTGAAVGPLKPRLPVRLATSTSTRIELEVPDAAVGITGSLVVAHHLAKARTLETNYRISAPAPFIAELNAGANVYPFVKKNIQIKIGEFSAARLDVDQVTFGGSCRFVKSSNISYGTRDRSVDLSLTFSISGWFETSGNCSLDVSLKPLTAGGAALAPIRLSAPFSVSAPVQYSFADTAALKTRLQPTLSHFGVGSFCNGTLPIGGPVGIVDSGGDFSILTRGGPLDVSCEFRTKEWILPEGVRLKGISWGTSSQGNRCGNAGSFSGTFPSVNFPLTRGTIVVRPNADQPATDFFVFSDKELVVDGVSYMANLAGPRTMIKPFVLGTQCVSSAVPLQTSAGTSLPTLDPQSFRVILESLILEGPPNLTLP